MDVHDFRMALLAGLTSAICAASSALAQTPPSGSAVPPPAQGTGLPPLPAPPPPTGAPYGTANPVNPGYGPAPSYAAPGYGQPPGYGTGPGQAAPGSLAAPPSTGAVAAPMPPDGGRAAPPPAMPLEMRYVEGRPIPPGYHRETRARRGLVITGSILFGVPYVFSLSSAASSSYQPDRWLYVPVLGPFIDLAQRGDRCTRSAPFQSGPGVTFTNESCTDDAAARWFIMFDGLMQTVGATMLVLGLALPHHLLVRDDAPFSSTGSTFAWTVRPQQMGRFGYGLGVDGTF